MKKIVVLLFLILPFVSSKISVVNAACSGGTWQGYNKTDRICKHDFTGLDCEEGGTNCTCTGGVCNTASTKAAETCSDYSESNCTTPAWECNNGVSCSWTSSAPTGGWGCTNPTAGSCSWVSNGTYGLQSTCENACDPGDPPVQIQPPQQIITPTCGSSSCGAGQNCCRSANPFCYDANASPSPCGDPPSGCTLVAPWCNAAGQGSGGYASVPGAMHTGCDEQMMAYESGGKIVISSVKSDGSPCSYNWGGPTHDGLAVWEYPVDDPATVPNEGVSLLDALRPNYPDFASKTLVGIIRNNAASIILDPVNQDPTKTHKFIINPACVTNAYYGGNAGITFEDAFVFNRDAARDPSSGNTAELRWYDMNRYGCYREVTYAPTTAPQAKTCAVILDGGSFVAGTPITATVTGGANWSTTDTVRLFLESAENIGSPTTASPITFTTTPAPFTTENTTETGPYYYQITDANCPFTNGQTCTSNQVEISGLPPGGYYLHCDVAGTQSSPLKCSGNPYCGYEGLGGPWVCAAWTSCSFSDNVNFEVTEAAPPAPTNLSAVCNAAVAGQFLPTAITLSWDIVSQANSYLIKVTDGVAGDNINALNATDTSINYADKIDCATTGTTDPDVCIRVSASINSIALNVNPDSFTGATWSVQAENTGGLSPVTTGSNIAPCSKTFTISGAVKVGRALASGDSCTNLGSVAWNDAQPITVEVVNTSESPPMLLGSDSVSSGDNGAYSISVTAPNGANLTTRLAQPTNTGSVKVQCTNTADTATISWNYIPTRTNHIARIDSAGYCNSTTNGISTWIPWYCGALGDQYVNNAGSCQDNLCTLTRNIIANRPYWSADIEPFEGASAQTRIKSASFICPSYPLDTVAYAVQCPSSGGFNFVSDGTNKSNLDIYVNNEFDPWWQTAGGNVFSYNPLAVYIPDDTCSAAFPSCDPYLITKELLSPSYSRLATRNSLSAGIPLSSVSVSGSTGGPLRVASYLTERSQQTKAGQAGVPSPVETYSYFKNLLDPSTSGHTLQSNAGFTDTIDSLADITGATIVNKTELYYSNTSLIINPGTAGTPETITIPDNRKIIIFVEGDLTINGTGAPGGMVTKVTPGGNLIFIVNGTITVAGSVGQVSESSTTPSLQGVFIGNFLTIASAAPSTELKFVGAGTFVGQFGVNLQRDFSGNSTGANRTSPTELFIFRPDFVTNWPELLKIATINWKELE